MLHTILHCVSLFAFVLSCIFLTVTFFKSLIIIFWTNKGAIFDNAFDWWLFVMALSYVITYILI